MLTNLKGVAAIFLESQGRFFEWILVVMGIVEGRGPPRSPSPQEELEELPEGDV